MILIEYNFFTFSPIKNTFYRRYFFIFKSWKNIPDISCPVGWHSGTKTANKTCKEVSMKLFADTKILKSSKILKSAKILNSVFWKAKILKSCKILDSGFWKAKIFKISQDLEFSILEN